MTRIRSTSLALIPLTVLALAACDEGTSPIDLGGLNPSAVATAVNGLTTPLQASDEAVANLETAQPDLADAGVDLDFSAESTVQFPENVAGSTFVYDPQAQGWAIDETRTGAPDNGVRVIWYELDGTDQVIDASEKGYIDLWPGDGDGNAPVAMWIAETGIEAPLLDFVQDYSWTTNGAEVETAEAEGSYADETRRVEFAMESVETMEIATGDVDYTFTTVMEDTDTRYEMVASSVADGATGEYDDSIVATVDHGGATTVVELRFQGVPSSPQAVTGSVRHNGTLVANVQQDGGGYVYVSPDGDEIPAAQSTELNALFQAVTLAWIQLLYELPLFFPAAV